MAVCGFSKVRYSRHHDLLTSMGLFIAFHSMRHLIRGATVWLGAPCASWIWMSRGSTRRCSIRPKGSKRLRTVRRMNKLVRRLCFLLLVSITLCLGGLACFKDLQGSNVSGSFLASKTVDVKDLKCHGYNLCLSSPRLEYAKKKGVFWIIEQPGSSLLPYYRPLQARPAVYAF